MQANEAVTPTPNGADIVAAWDRGDSVWSVEMGGLGPGYEQAIQCAMVEIVRDNIGKPLPDPENPADEKALDEFGYDTIRKHDEKLLGLSGAQAGAARSLAYRILSKGYEPTLASARAAIPDRMIQVSNSWPSANP